MKINWLKVIGIVVLAFLVPALFWREEFSCGSYELDVFLCLLYVIVLWEGNQYIFTRASKAYPHLSEYKKRILIQSVAILAFSTASIFLIQAVIQYFIGRMPHPDLPFEAFKVSILFTVIVTLIYESVFLQHKWKDAALEAEKVKKLHYKSQLDSLKNQISPHFLFNNLNSLDSLLLEDTKKASKFVKALSEVYRYVLEQKDKELVSVRDELDFLQSYIFLLKTRFEDNINIMVDISPKSHEKMLPPLTLQLLLENAIKHNVSSKKQPLNVKIETVNHVELIVNNDLQLKNNPVQGTSLGLKNIVERYKYFTNEEVRIDKTTTSFIVKVPLLAL